MNFNLSFVELTNQVCSGECSSDDCWGAGPDKCFECPYFKHTDTCLTSCISSEK